VGQFWTIVSRVYMSVRLPRHPILSQYYVSMMCLCTKAFAFCAAVWWSYIVLKGVRGAVLGDRSFSPTVKSNTSVSRFVMSVRLPLHPILHTVAIMCLSTRGSTERKKKKHRASNEAALD
jgi:hypothetical protein